MAVSLIAGIIAGASTAIVTGAFSWLAFGIVAGLSMITRALTPKLDLGAQMGGRSVMTRDAASSRKIIYGRARVGGNVVYLESTGTDNKYLWLVTAIAGHEIDAYEEVWFNDEKIWDGGSFVGNWGSYVSISFKDGSQTTADSGLVAASTKWTSNHILLDTAYMVVKLTYDQEQFAQGLPNISTVIRGKKVWHPNNSSLVWSQNPALCLRDYLTDTKYGLGESTSNIASINTAFGVCNETVALAAGGTQPRYTIDGVIDTGDSLKSNIELMVGSMAGRLIYASGKFEIHAGKYVAPTVTIDESQIVGEIKVQTKQSRRNGYNAVKGVFLSEEDNYVLADYPAQLSKTTAGSFVTGDRYKILIIGSTDFTAIGASANTVGLNFTATGAGSGSGTASLFLAEDDEQIYLDMPLPLTVNNIRAQRLARLALLRSRQQEAITMACNLSALRFNVGDNINITNARLGYSQKVFEVTGYSTSFDSSGEIIINVQAIETASSVWDWSSTDEEVFLGGGEVDLYDGSFTQRPASIAVAADSYMGEDGTFRPYFSVTWPASVDAFVDHYIVEWRTGTGDYLSQATRTSPLQITNLQDGASYNVRVKAVNGLGVQSLTRDATPTAATDATAPDVPTNPLATGEYRQITISWTNPTQKDLKAVEVFRSETLNGTYTYVGSGDTSFIDTDLETPKTYYYKIRSYDFTFNKSAYTAIISATSRNVNITAPDNPDVIIYDGESGLPPSVTSGRTSLDTNTSTFYLKQDYKESLKLHLTYPVGALTSGSVAGQTNAINSTMAAFKFQVFYALTSSPTSFTQLGLDVSSVRRTTTGQLISNYYVKTTDLGGGNFQADLQTASQVQALFPTLDGLSLGIIDDNYNLRETLVAYDFPAGEYVFKVVVTVTDGSASSYPATGSPATNLKRKVDAVGYEVFKKSGHTFALKPFYQPITIFRDDSSNEIVRLSEGADTLELSAINSSGVPVQAFVGGGASSTTTWGARIQFDDDLDSYTNGGIGQYQIGIDKSGTRLSLGTAPTDGSYARGLNPSLSELQISSGRTDIKGTLYLNDVAVGTGSGSISGVTAGTNLNGGGTSGTVTLNLDSTISGDHTFSNNLIVSGNLTVNGTTTTVDTDNLNVKDKNITVNYSSGDSSSTANGAGITIQDAVNSTTNATMLWDSTNDEFDFSHNITAPNLSISNWNTAYTYSQVGHLPLSGGTLTGAVTTNSTFDGRDVATDGTKLDTIATSANNYVFPYTVSSSVGNSTVVQRTSSGYIYANYFNTAPNDIASGSITKILAESGDDGFMRHATAAVTRTFLNVADGANNYTLPFTDNSSNWNTAYTYSQVGHLPLAGGTLTGDLTINSTNDNQILLTSPSSWTGIGFNDSATMATDYIWHNGIYGTFAIGGGGSNVVNKKLHVDGGMTIGSSYDATAVTANSLNVQGTVTATGGNSGQWNTAYTVANAALPKAGGTMTGTLAMGANAITSTGSISSGAITAAGSGTTTATFTNSGGNGGYVNIKSNVGGVATDGNVGLHIGWNKSNGGREINMIFDGGTAQADTEMIFTSTDGSTYTDIFQINGAVGTGVDIKSGGLRIGSTTVIEASRNLKNVPVIYNNNSGLQAIDLNNADSLIFDTPDGHSALLLSGGAYDTNYYSNETHYFRGIGVLDIHAIIDTTGIKSFGDYKVGSQTVIDASRNLTNIGTINSGAITSSGGISGTTAAFTDTVTMSGSGILNITKGLGVYITNNLSVSGLIYKTGGADVEVSGNLRVNSGGLKIGTTSVIDSSRNFYASNYGRTSHHTGYLVGGYNNVGSSGGKSSPIYSIGSNYTASDTSLGNMYGIGYTTYTASLTGTIPGGNDWGMYVAAGGVGRVWLDGANGNIGSVGGVYATNGYHVGTTNVIDSSRNLNNIAAITASGNITFSGTQGIARSHGKKYHWVSPVTVTNASDTRQTQVFRVYYCPNHWTNTPINLDVELRALYYEQFSASFSVSQGYSQSEPEVFLKHQAFNQFNVRLVKGTKTSAGFNHSGQPVYYTDFYIWCNTYMTAWVELTSTNGFLTSNPTSGWGATVVNNSNTTNTTANTPPALMTPNLGVGGMMDGKTFGVGSISVTNGGAIQSYTASGSLRGYFGAVESGGGTAAGLVIATSGGETISFKDGGLSGTLNAEITGGGDLNLITGTLDINGTTVIDANRNLTNIGTINSTHFFTSSNMNGTGVGGLNIHSGRLGFDQSGTRSWTVGAASGYLNIYSGDGNGDLNLANSIGLRLNGTTVIDASRNLTNIGSISSGAITTSNVIKVDAGHGTARMQLVYDDQSAVSTKGTLTAWVSEPGLTYSDAGIGANIHVSGQYYGRAFNDGYGVYARFRKSTGAFEVWNTQGTSGGNGQQGTQRLDLSAAGVLNLPTGYLQIGSTTVIDASRNVTATGATFTDTVTMSGSGILNITKGLGVYVSNNLSVSGLIYNTTGADVGIYGDTSISSGDLDVSGALSKGSGSFKIEHPLPEKRETHNLVHSFVEAPQADNIYRGKVSLVDGSATVNIDAVAGMSEGTYVLLNTNTQCFTSNESGWTAVKGLVSGNILTIEAKEPCSDTISWMVIGERHDQHMIDAKWTDKIGKVIVEPEKTLDANNDKINKLKAQLSKRK